MKEEEISKIQDKWYELAQGENGLLLEQGGNNVDEIFEFFSKEIKEAYETGKSDGIETTVDSAYKYL